LLRDQLVWDKGISHSKQQDNGSDCGIYTAANAIAILLHGIVQFPDNIGDFRKSMMQEVIEAYPKVHKKLQWF
jgi:Ulp1 family protease